MDGAAAAADAATAVREDGAGMTPSNGADACEDSMRPTTVDIDEGVGVLCCRDCGEAFREEAAYTEHCHQHLQESMYLDKQTDGFHVAEKDREQTAGTTNQQTFECPDCGKCYGVFGHFLNHQRSHRQASKSVFHDLEHLKKKSFQCESCGRSYSRASALDAHRRCHEEKLVKARNRSSGDAFHIEESTVEANSPETQTDSTPTKLFECSCGKAFPALMRLKTHQRFSRNSQCTPEEMKEKQKKICGEFNCSECNKTFSSHIALFNHQRWHSKYLNDSENKFPCELCGKVFMTPTFYYRHQRTAHSDETPSKSFLHQVCQLQKKAFECKDCGLKFSRASALHSHQLHHTDNFRETEAGGQTSLPPQQVILISEREDTEQEQGQPEDVLSTSMAETESPGNETDEDIECYGPGDFNVQVISASESDDESAQDPNPDLELLCESDQEQRDYCDTGAFPSKMLSKPEMDLKIVQIDFDPADMQCASVEGEPVNNLTGQRFDCPDCYRWFNSASSLRVHRMWHGIRKRRHQVQVKRGRFLCTDCGVKFSNLAVFEAHMHQHALEVKRMTEEEAEKEENRSSAVHLNFNNVDDVEDTGGDEHLSTLSSPEETTPPGSLNVGSGQLSMKSNDHSCEICGKVYKYLSSFTKHMQQHGYLEPVHKLNPKSSKYECPDCGMRFVRKARLCGHMRIHKSRGPVNLESLKCDQCNKTFASEKSWMTHIELHKLKPFWCLSCAKGFFSEDSLEKHLLNHDLRKYSCNICSKSFRLHTQLMHHLNTHTGAKPFQCTVCGTSFSHPGNLISHRKKHVRVYAGSSGMPLGMKRSAIIAKKLEIKKQRLASASATEETDANMSELQEERDWMEESRTKNTHVNAEFGDSAQHDDMTARELLRLGKISKPQVTDALRSAMLQTQPGQQLDQTDTPDTIMFEEHKYWEWECCLCEMGFDEVAELHMHYIKHASGELPVPHDVL